MGKKMILTIVVWMAVVTPVLADTVKSTSEDQKSIAVTIYNNNLGLIKDVRSITLKKGVQDVRFMDVAQQINPVTVHIKSLTAPNLLKVLEQNYEYDLLNSSKLFDKYVGKKVKIVEKNEYTGEEKTHEAEILSNNQGPIFKIDNEIYVGAPGRVIFPQIPENLIAKPTLVWLLDNENPKAQEIEASYLTSGINWKADYIAVINQQNTSADLSGWVTINNQSGATYQKAKVKLVAGEVNKVQPTNQRVLYSMREDSAMPTGSGGFQEESFFEYHLYSLQRPATIKENQTKQIELLSAVGVPVKQRLIYYGSDYYYRNRYTGKMESKEHPGVFLEFENKQENKLGMPLPAGIIRAYKEDSQGSLQFIGEDRIDHTPKDEKVLLKMGNAFDVVIERTQLDYQRLATHMLQRFDVEQEWKIEVRNHKEEAVSVEIIERLPGDWQMLRSNVAYEKTEAHTVKFIANVLPDGKTEIDYRIKVDY